MVENTHPIEYDVRVNLRGFPAYVVDKLLDGGLHGLTRDEVVDRILCETIEAKLKDGTFREARLTPEEAFHEGYLPARVDPGPED